jgi:Transposase DDE domain group 1
VSIQSAWQFVFGFHPAQPIVVEASQAQLSSDAGLLPIRQFDEQIQLTAQFAGALQDLRDPALLTHSRLSMVRQRVYGILADYEDQNDHDTLRSDPVFKLLADRHPDEDDLASQPTLSRFENAVTIPDLFRLRDLLVDQFIASFTTPPVRLTLDLDAFDDPTHGQQQLTFFHGFYEQYQYLPLVVTCAESDHVLLVGLRHGTCAASLGADDDLRYVVERLRAAWPDVEIHARADSGFGVPAMYGVCEALGLFYTFGIGMNARLKQASDALLAQAATQYEQTGQPQRLFVGTWYQAGSWECERFVVLKAEAHAQGTNRRAVVTNRPGAPILPQATYDEYTERGESENRNKELKEGLKADRLSDHRFMANFFRLYLHAAALNLLVRLRRAVSENPTPRELGMPDPLPAESLAGSRRRTYFNRRRQSDPLGEGHPCTWRTRLIKVAAEVLVSSRRVLVRLSSSWPHLDHFAAVSKIIARGAADTG